MFNCDFTIIIIMFSRVDPLLILAGSSHFALRFLQHSCCWRPVYLRTESPGIAAHYHSSCTSDRWYQLGLAAKRINQFDFRLNQKYKFEIKHFSLILTDFSRNGWWLFKDWFVYCVFCSNVWRKININFRPKTADSFTRQTVRSEFTSILVYSTSTTRFLGSHKC